MDMKTHLKIGETVEGTIDKVAFGGEGICRTEGLVIFVPYTAPGDRVRIRIDSIKKNYARGRAQQLLSASPFRVKSDCRFFTRCGGCQYQHIAYNHQLHIKQTQIADTFQRIGFFRDVAIGQIISGKSYGYRGKAEFHLNFMAGKRLEAGFMNAGANQIIDLDRCEIMEENINSTFAALREKLAWSYERPARLILWSETDPFWRKNDQHFDTPARRFISRRAKGRSFLVPYHGFFQANTGLVDHLVDQVVESSSLQGTETVLDCYCGSGLFSLFLAGRCRQIHGIEINPEAVHCATRNAREFGCTNAKFTEGKTENVLNDMKQSGVKPDLIVLDPPRTGCPKEVIAGMISLKPERIVYVSCDPPTQARDIRLLEENGFHLEGLKTLDMFPQTKHVEVVASLARHRAGC